MNRDEILRAIDETRDWDDCEEKTMRLVALYSMIRARAGQNQFKPKVFLDRDQMRVPGKWDKALHVLGVHQWLEYDDNNFFDGTRRICLICGLTQSSPLKRIYGYDPCNYGELDLEEVLEYIEEMEP